MRPLIATNNLNEANSYLRKTLQANLIRWTTKNDIISRSIILSTL